MSQHVTVLCWNLKRNGAGDTTKRRRAHELLASLDPHLVLRQEMDGAAADGNRIMYEVEAVLGLRGWLGPRACTAVFANPTLFQPLRVCEDVGPVWVHPPTVAVFRFTPGGSQSLPLVVASYHLNHASATTRQAEVERLTKWADRKWTMPDGERMLMPALMGGDNNSYPVPGLEGDLPCRIWNRSPTGRTGSTAPTSAAMGSGCWTPALMRLCAPPAWRTWPAIGRTPVMATRQPRPAR